MRLSLPLAAVVLAGCGEPRPPAAAVGGAVTVDSVPLAAGTVRFEPADRPGAPAVTAPVKDGRYGVPDLPRGKYAVGFGPPADAPAGPATSETNAKPDGRKNPIPEKYRRPALPAEVTGDDPNLNFELKSR